MNPHGMQDGGRPQTLVDSVVGYGICTLDLNGMITAWNAGAEKATGHGADEMIGRHFSRLFEVKDQQLGMPNSVLGRTHNEGRCEFEGWRVRKDGGRFWSHAIIDPIRDGQGNVTGFVKIFRDITDPHRTQQALMDSERQFRLFVSSIVDYSLFMLDRFGVVATWNAGAERIKGYRAEEIIGSHFSRFYTDEDRLNGKPARALEIAARTGRFESEGWRVRKDGSRFWASVTLDAIKDEAGILIGFAKITRDTTEQRAVHETLTQSERQFRLLTSGVTDCALYMLDLNGVIASWNAGAERIEGYAANEVIGSHFSRFYTEEDRLAGTPARALKLALERGKYSAEGWRVRQDGGAFWASVVIELIRDENDLPIGFAKITRDSTELHEAQSALESAHAQIVRSQKMESLGQLTAGLAHDFNNLLMIISSQTQLLGKWLPEDLRVQRAIGAMRIATERGARITRQLLSFARKQPLNPAPLNLRDRINSLRDLLSSSTGEVVRVSVEMPEDLWLIDVDVNELELALVNLAINARDAMPKGGDIVISAHNVLDKQNRGAEGLHGDYVALSVKDTGAGIPKDILSKIFDPFFTTKDVDKGTGLGLSQVYGFAHQSGGTVTVESEVDIGTKFTLYFPRSRTAESPSVEQDETHPETAMGTVLVVDDDPDVARASADLVKELGMATIVAGNAEAALRVLAENTRISLLFSDIVMAGSMNGVGLAQAVREKYPEIPILLTTGYNSAHQTNDFPILHKPYELGDLSRAISLLQQKQKIREEKAEEDPVVDLAAIRRDRLGHRR